MSSTSPDKPTSATIASTSTSKEKDTDLSIETPLSKTQADRESWSRLFYNSSVGICIAAPIIALLPPRKVDLYTFGLGIAWVMSADHVVQVRTGRGIVWHLGTRLSPEGREILKEYKEQRKGVKWMGGDVGLKKAQDLESRIEEEKRRISEQQQRQIDEEDQSDVTSHETTSSSSASSSQDTKKDRGILKRIWMGDQDDDWVEVRKKQEREALEDGRGYGGLIMDQLRDVWGSKKGDDDDDGGGGVDGGDEKNGK